MNEEEEENLAEVENDPSTWAYILKKHWDDFSESCWSAFNKFCEDTCREGHDNKISVLKWREYVLWDMKRRHHKEKNKTK